MLPWQPAAGIGWQHGAVPAPPEGLGGEALAAWRAWFGSWWASFWTTGDLPVIELAAVTWDRVAAGEVDVAKLVPLLDRLGITPKGRQDLRWAPPTGTPADASAASADELQRRRARKGKIR